VFRPGDTYLVSAGQVLSVYAACAGRILVYPLIVRRLPAVSYTLSQSFILFFISILGIV